MDIEEICYDIGEQSIHGLACGDAQAPVLLCLHGWLDNAASFTPLMSYLDGFRVIAIDWPGHGFSSHRGADAHYHFIDWVFDLAQLFDINGWENIDIIGHSMGGMVASAFAAAFPEKVARLHLLDSIGFVVNDPLTTTEQLRKGIESRLKGRNKRKNIHPSETSAIQARVAVSDLSYDQAKLIVKRGLIKQEEGYIWRSDSRLRATSPYRLTKEQAQQLISDITAPVNLLYGKHGLAMVHQGIKDYVEFFQQISLTEFDGGHHLHMEVPKLLAQSIKAFIKLNRSEFSTKC